MTILVNLGKKYEDFCLDETASALQHRCCLNAVKPGEHRVVRDSGGGATSTAFIVDASGSERRVLPEGLVDAPCLTMSVDHGSIGAAGSAFAENQLGVVWLTRNSLEKQISSNDGTYVRMCVRTTSYIRTYVHTYIRTYIGTYVDTYRAPRKQKMIFAVYSTVDTFRQNTPAHKRHQEHAE